VRIKNNSNKDIRKNKINQNYLLLIILPILFFFILFSLFIISNYSSNLSFQFSSPNIVVKIIDGDTFELASGDIVRLICVDAPEKGRVGAKEAEDFLFFLIYNQEVRLERDVDDKDRYERLLRYVYVNVTDNDVGSSSELFVNQELVEKGYAKLFVYGNNTRCDKILK
jgi:endonuclease YncB( thermonuclease family)